MARFLVTGGAGFIGSHLVDDLLRNGHDVRVLDNLSTGSRQNVSPDAEFLFADVRDAEAVRAAMAGVDGCFHLAAIASVQAANADWFGTHQTNLSGAVAVFEGALRARQGPLPVVYASSAAVYGEARRHPLTERAPTRPITAYGADKLGCELHAAAAARTHGVSTVGLRFFNVYGPRQDPRSPYSGVISIFAERLLRGLGVTIFGDGAQTRDFVFVGDVCKALQAAMHGASCGRSLVFNVCTGRETAVRDLADTIARLTGARSALAFAPPRAGDIHRSVGDPSYLARVLGVSPSTPIETGLVETLSWMANTHASSADFLPIAARNPVAA